MIKIRKKLLGFTLIELLVVISIIGILASFLFANFVGIRQRSRDGVRKSDLRQIQSALELYRADKGNYPDSLPVCGSPFTDGSSTPVVYMQKISCDPSGGGTSYTYIPSGTNNSSYTLIACLENSGDSQRDGTLDSRCTTPASYTVANP